MPSGTASAPRKVLIILGHPDSNPNRLCHAIARSYEDGARRAGHQVKSIDVGALDFSLLRSKKEWEESTTAPAISEAQKLIAEADHLVLVYPLWLGCMPALLKGFLEQVMRPGFAMTNTGNGFPKRMLAGKSARVIVTMGMPEALYRWYFAAHSLRVLKRNILGFCGVDPIRDNIVGMVESANYERRVTWLAKFKALGARAI